MKAAAMGTTSLEQLVIDDDIYERIFRISDGIRTEEDALAMDVIAAIGPARHLEEAHTIKYICPGSSRRTECSGSGGRERPKSLEKSAGAGGSAASRG